MEKFSIFLFMFLILIFLGTKLILFHTTPISFLEPKGTSTISPFLTLFLPLRLYVKGKLNTFGSKTCNFIPE